MYVNLSIENDAVKDAQSIIADEIKKSIHVTRILSSKKQILNFGHEGMKNIYYLASGEIEIRNLKNKMIIANVIAPAILGVSTLLVDTERYYIQTTDNSEFYSVSASDFTLMIEERKLWRHISVILTYTISLYYCRDLLLSQSNVYSIIRNQLEMLWEQNSVKQENISVFDYILHRTPVSRSSLNKVLKDLAKGGYIKLNRGRLVEMNKLPPGY